MTHQLGGPMPAIHYNKSCHRPIWNAVWAVQFPSFGYDVSNPDDFAYAMLVDETHETKKECPVNTTHETDLKCTSIRVEVHGENVGPFVPLADHGFVLVSDEFANMLADSHFSGFDLNPKVEVVDWCISGEIAPNASFVPRDRSRQWDQAIHRSCDDYICSTCGKDGPFCKGCGQMNIMCPNCGSRLINAEWNILTDDDKKRFFWIDALPEVPIIDAAQWDQQDWFSVPCSSDCVSDRVKRWLVENEITQMEIKPAILDLGPVP